MGTEPWDDDGFDIGEITPEELRKNDELRKEAARWAKNEGAAVLAKASAPGNLGPQPRGRPITPEEIAEAMGARNIGPAKHS